MSSPSRPARSRRRRRRGRTVRVLVGVGVVLLVFVVGVALGEALNDKPRPGGDRTYVRTLRPLPVAPAGRTVTVTVTASPQG